MRVPIQIETKSQESAIADSPVVILWSSTRPVEERLRVAWIRERSIDADHFPSRHPIRIVHWTQCNSRREIRGNWRQVGLLLSTAGNNLEAEIDRTPIVEIDGYRRRRCVHDVRVNNGSLRSGTDRGSGSK